MKDMRSILCSQTVESGFLAGVLGATTPSPSIGSTVCREAARDDVYATAAATEATYGEPPRYDHEPLLGRELPQEGMADHEGEAAPRRGAGSPEDMARGDLLHPNMFAVCATRVL